MRKPFLAAFLLLFATQIVAQRPTNFSVTIKGKVLTPEDKPVSYVDVIVKAGDKVIDAILTQDDGSFSLNPTIEFSDIQQLTIEVQSINYKPYTSPIKPKRAEVWNLGKIRLEENLNEIEGISLVAEKKSVEYKIDKKVVNVDDLKVDVSGSVVNILENVPSINVNAEGNVSLRGQSNFKVYIDGKPSILEGSDALNQIPASLVKNIEIITNPSARYEAEGSGGIINVITDKKKATGYSGKLAGNYGTFNTGGAEGFFQMKKNGYDFVINSSYNKRIFRRNTDNRSRIETDSEPFLVENIGQREFNMSRREIGSSLSKFFDEEGSYLSIEARFGRRNFAILRDVDIKRNTAESFSKSTLDIVADYIGINQTGKLAWDESNQQLEYLVSYRNLEKTEDKSFNELSKPSDQRIDAQAVNEIGGGSRWRSTLDYTYDIDKDTETKLETGLFFDRTEDNLYQVFNMYDKTTDKLVRDNQNTRNLDVTNFVYAGYVSFQSKLGAFGYKVGLRAENFKRNIFAKETNLNTDDELFNWFPTTHFSYNFSKAVQTYLSYARRINRPRGWQVEPSQMWMDANNIFSGNQDLLPSFAHTAEFGLSYDFIKGANFYTEVFYKFTEDIFQFLTSIYDPSKGQIRTDRKDVFLNTPTNIGDRESVGVETGLRMPLSKRFMTNVTFTGFNQRVLPDADQPLVKKSEIFTWNTNVNLMTKLPLNTTFVTNFRYSGARNTIQGRIEPNYQFDFSLRGDFGFLGANDKSNLKQLQYSLVIRDAFKTRENINAFSFGRTTATYIDRPQQPFVNFSLSYTFNNFRAKRSRDDMDIQ